MEWDGLVKRLRLHRNPRGLIIALLLLFNMGVVFYLHGRPHFNVSRFDNIGLASAKNEVLAELGKPEYSYVSPDTNNEYLVYKPSWAKQIPILWIPTYRIVLDTNGRVIDKQIDAP